MPKVGTIISHAIVLAGFATVGLAIYRGDVLFLSMSIFFTGIFYAILERNLIIGLIIFATVLLLPWIKIWITNYWPSVKGSCFILLFRH